MNKGKTKLDFGSLCKGEWGHTGKFDSAKKGTGGSKDKLGQLDAGPGNPKTLNQDYPGNTNFDSTASMDKMHKDRSLTKDYGK